MDHFGASSYAAKPSGIVCYSAGGFGGVRAAMQLRPFLSELGCISVSNIFAVSTPQNTYDEAGVPNSEKPKEQFAAFKKQLYWMAYAMKTHREAHGTF